MLILDLIYLLLLLLSWPFWLKYVLKKSYRPLLKGRLRPQLQPAGEKAVWIHAVSVGEVRSLRSLIAALSSRGQRLVLSVTTPAGFDFARREYPAIPTIQAPLDFSFVVRRFIDRIQPRLVIFNELEIWPNWIALLRRRGVPMMLINGRISAKAFRRYRVFLPILRPFFRRIDAYLVQNELYRQRFLLLGIPAGSLTVCGNIKADEAENSLQGLPAPAVVRASLRLAGPSRRIVVLASSHEADEKVFIPAIAGSAEDLLFIIVPRHLERAPAICSQLQDNAVAHALFSRQEAVGARTRAMVYDRMGYLLPIMSIADVVFMGGTFDAATGGHNLYEPAALGKAIVGGPHYNNFPDIGRALEQSGAYRRVNDSNEWRNFLAEYPGLDLQQIDGNARKAVAARKGALACSLARIERYLA
jgi:3-deoxy-D-manno-octulosonic-acid transferase